MAVGILVAVMAGADTEGLVAEGMVAVTALAETSWPRNCSYLNGLGGLPRVGN